MLAAFTAMCVLTLAPASSVRAARSPLPAQADELSAVQVVLDQRARALLAHDKDAFMATVDPEAPDAFRTSQSNSFDGWAAMPLDSYHLDAKLDDTGDLSAGAAARFGDAKVLVPETRQRHRLRGYDDRDAVEALWLTYVQRSGRWYVGSDTDLEDLGLDTSRNIWELGEVRLQQTTHFLVISHPAQAKRADALAGIAEDAVGILESRWDLEWSQRLPLVVPGSVKELEVLLQSTVDLDKFVAFVGYGSTRDDGRYASTAPRCYVQDQNLSRYPRDYQVETLVHELTHAAAAPLAGPFVPNWVHEGVAEWVARGRPLGAPRSVDHLPRDYQFGTGTSGEIVGAYNASRVAITALAKASGVTAPTALLRDLGAVQLVPGNQDYQVDASLRRVARIGAADLERLA